MNLSPAKNGYWPLLETQKTSSTMSTLICDTPGLASLMGNMGGFRAMDVKCL